MRLVALAFISMAVLTAVSAIASIRTDLAVRQIIQRQLVVQSHSERFTVTGNAIELLVQLAVRTGEPKYTAAYARSRAELQQIVRELRDAVVLPGNARSATLMEQAKRRRLQLDDAALARAANGDRTGGMQILESPAYRRFSRIYRENAVAIQRRSDGYIAELQADLDRSSWTIRIASLVGIPLILVAWLLLVGPARRWGREMHRIRNAAEAAARAKGDFLATMSHEVRTPLNSILGYTQLLLLDRNASKEQRHHLELVQEAGTALLVVVNDILDYSAIEAGRLSLDRQRFSLASLVDNAASIVRGQAIAKGLELNVSVDPALQHYFVGDQNRLRQVLLNLLNNAIKFTASGEVWLKVRSAGGDGADPLIAFRVEDTGIGISQDKQAQLFERFVQADSTVTRNYGGSGLGLAISKRLVTLMGGEIGIESKPGEGSTFWFTVALPAASEPALSEQSSDAREGFGSVGPILLVEDVEVNRELACAMLAHLGLEVHTACDGIEAVAAVKRGCYPLVLMDIQMPRMDGMTATRAIRELEGPVARTPIVAMTANVLPQQVREFRAAGMDGHIAKPVNMCELAREIRRVLALAGSADSGGEQTPWEPAFDPSLFDQLQRLLPRDRVRAYLDDLAEQVRGFRCADSATAGPIAHKLVAQAGYLGFSRLSRMCAEYEEAAKTGPATAERRAVLKEGELAIARMAELQAELRAPAPAAAPLATQADGRANVEEMDSHGSAIEVARGS